MIKKLFLTAIITVFTTAVFAEGGRGLIDLGIRGGLTTQSIKLVHPNKGDFDLSLDSRAGFHLGLVSRINLATFHIQPELLFTHSSYRLNANPTAITADGSRTTVRMNTVDLPVLAGLRLLWFRFQAGPVFNLMTDNSLKNKGNIKEVIIDKPTLSYMLGIGFDIGRLNLDVRYNGRFARSDQSIQFRENDFLTYKTKFSGWMFGVAYLF